MMPTIEYCLNHPYSLTPKFFKKNFPDFYKIILSYPGKRFSEQLYNYYYPEQHICKICGNPTNFINFKKGYHVYCSHNCSVKDKEVTDKIKQSNIDSRKDGNIQSKIKQTMMKKYGGYTTMESNILKQKVQQTMMKKYGCAFPGGSKIIQEKIKRTNLEKYGVDNIFKDCNIQLEINDIKKQYNIQKQNNLIGYTENGEWICKCPHPLTCNQCVDKCYITDCMTRHNRLNLHNELCTKLFPVGSKEIGISNSSQSYFDQLNQYFPDSIYYKKSGYEYKIGRYSLDFYIPSLKIDIEFNGVLYHMKPTLYKPTDINPINNKTAQEIWDHDRKRKKYIESKGIKVIVVWEDELIKPKYLKELIISI